MERVVKLRPNLPDSFDLSEDDDNLDKGIKAPVATLNQRPRYIPDRKGYGERESVSARIPASMLREISIYVESAKDPYIKTRSDFICDAIVMSLWDLDQRAQLPPGTNVGIVERWREQEIQRIESYDTLLKNCHDYYNRACSGRDFRAIKNTLSMCKMVRQTFIDGAQPEQLHGLDSLIHFMQETLDHAS